MEIKEYKSLVDEARELLGGKVIRFQYADWIGRLEFDGCWLFGDENYWGTFCRFHDADDMLVEELKQIVVTCKKVVIEQDLIHDALKIIGSTKERLDEIETDFDNLHDVTNQQYTEDVNDLYKLTQKIRTRICEFEDKISAKVQ